MQGKEEFKELPNGTIFVYGIKHITEAIHQSLNYTIGKKLNDDMVRDLKHLNTLPLRAWTEGYNDWTIHYGCRSFTIIKILTSEEYSYGNLLDEFPEDFI